jgi:hypothetical protein
MGAKFDCCMMDDALGSSVLHMLYKCIYCRDDADEGFGQRAFFTPPSPARHHSLSTIPQFVDIEVIRCILLPCSLPTWNPDVETVVCCFEVEHYDTVHLRFAAIGRTQVLLRCVQVYLYVSTNVIVQNQLPLFNAAETNADRQYD